MISIDLLCEGIDMPSWVEEVKSFVLDVLQAMDRPDWSMAIIFVSDEVMKTYNKQWRSIDGTTDVLSFVEDDGEPIPGIPQEECSRGDVLISPATVERNSALWGTSYNEEMKRVIIHGLLHLDGLDHPGDDYSHGMLKLQENLLDEFNEVTLIRNHGTN